MRVIFSTEAAKELGICAGTLRRLEREGKVPKAKRMLGYRRIYTQEDIEHLREILFTAVNKK